jgi:DeoR/GlpR family transcriptional regulator of sugar metabolism
MLPAQRKQAMLNYLSKHGGGSISELSSLLNVSEMTVRRDLKFLEEERFVERTYGGAVYLQPPNHEPKFDEKKEYHRGLKELIAGYAAKHFVKNNSVILLEGGTTVTCLTNYLSGYAQLTMITNGLNTAAALRGMVPSSTVLCSGGMLRDVSMTFVGPLAENFFRQFHAQTVFLSATGVTIGEGFTDPNLLDSHVKRAMCAAAQRKVMVVDSTKFGYCSLLTTFQPQDIDVLVTDDGAPADIIEELKSAGMEIHIVSKTGEV